MVQIVKGMPVEATRSGIQPAGNRPRSSSPQSASMTAVERTNWLRMESLLLPSISAGYRGESRRRVAAAYPLVRKTGARAMFLNRYLDARRELVRGGTAGCGHVYGLKVRYIDRGPDEIRGSNVPSAERARRLPSLSELNDPRLNRFVIMAKAPPRASLPSYRQGNFVRPMSCDCVGAITSSARQNCPNDACRFVGQGHGGNKSRSPAHDREQPW